MDFVTRLKQYIEYTTLPVSQFADTAQIPRPTLSQILNGRNKKISNELIAKLHTGFPSLNILWLLFGDGPMEVDSIQAGGMYRSMVQAGSSVASQGSGTGNSLFDTALPEAHEFEERAPYGFPDSYAPASSSYNPESGYQQTDRSSSNGYRNAAPQAQTTPTRNSLARDNSRQVYPQSGATNRSQQSSGSDISPNPAVPITPDSSKRVQSIMVFYTDNSFEIFTPSK